MSPCPRLPAGWLRIALTAFLLWSAGPFTATGQELPRALRFGTATVRDGLPSASVRCLARDRQGFLWVGTDDGLARYDGVAFQVWRHRRSGPRSLADNVVLSIAEDRWGRLWVGTHGGVSRLDAAREAVHSWQHDPADSTSPSANYDDRLLVTRAGTVWLGNSQGLSRYDEARNAWHRLRLPGDGGVLSALYEDRAGRLWLGTPGVVRLYDPRTGRVLTALRLPPPPGNAPAPVTGFFEDHRGQMWATTWGDGLVRLNISLGQATALLWDLHPPVTGVANIVASVAETRDLTGRYTLWLGTNLGLRRLDQPRPGADWPATLASSILYPHQPTDAASPAPTDISALLTDPVETLWIGASGGLSWLVPGQQAFESVSLANGKLSGLWPQALVPEHDPVTHQLQFWLPSWYGDGLALYDSAFQLVNHWRRLPMGSPAFNAGQICDVVRSRADGLLWVATFNGLVRFDPTTKQTRLFRGSRTNSTLLMPLAATHLTEDRYGRLWIGTWRDGLFWLRDRAKGIFQHVPTAHAVGQPGLPFDLVTVITEDRAGRLWAAGEGGLARFDPAVPGEWRAYWPDATNPRALPHYRINALWPAPDGRLWVATTDGIAIWRPETDDFDQLNSLQGLPCDNVYGIAPDRAGRVWLTTQRGLVRVEGPRGPFRLFDQTDGLPENDLNGLLQPLPDGRLALGLPGRLLLVNPGALRLNRHPPPVVLTEVRLFDDVLRLGRPLDSVACLALEPTQNTLTFAFSALNYTNAARNSYYYRLDGVDSRWISAGSRRYATYANLRGGEYTFRVRATNEDGTRSRQEATFRVRVRPPLAQTWGFWSALGLVAGGLVRARIRGIRRQAEQQTRLNQEMAGLELTALRAQMNPHFIYNALNAVQQCVLDGRAAEANRYLTRFARLLRLVLENSERTFVPLDAELESLRLYLELEGLRLADLCVTVDVDPELELASPRVPAMVLQPYLENALWHGLAARPVHQRRLRLALAFADAEETAVRAEIEDSGIGRQAAAVRRPATARHRSMGLRLTERRLQLLGEGILPPQVTDLTDPATGEASGTRVVVWLPIG